MGCVPKKVMFNTAMHAEMIHDHKDYGFDVTVNKFDWRYVYRICRTLLYLRVCKYFQTKHFLGCRLNASTSSLQCLYQSYRPVRLHIMIFSSVIKKTRDAYIKRLNGIYENNLEKVF